MHLTHLTSAQKSGFRGKLLHRRAEQRMPPWVYLKQKSSFLIAAVSLVAFVAGNMIGSHGLYAFWKSVWGNEDDSLIVYTGTVPPIERVPDYGCWASLGGGGEDHTYRQVPQQCLVPLPPYDRGMQDGTSNSRVYEVGHLGSYQGAGDFKGSHFGVDIAAPKDTPALAIANGIVTSVREDRGGFGKLIVIRHPHMPDPDHPGTATVLHSVYAHLSAQLVTEGEIVQKGQVIGFVGSTGSATGNHLHFQIDRDTLADGKEVPWHPQWAFSAAEAREAGLTLAQAINSGFRRERGMEVTVHPMLYVQANYLPATNSVRAATTVAGAEAIASSSPSVGTPAALQQTQQPMRERLLALRDVRRQQRLARQAATMTQPATIVTDDGVVSGEGVVSSVPSPLSSGQVRTIDIVHDRSFAGRGWENLTVTLLDEVGHPVDGSALTRDLYLRTAYGDAEFRPAVLSPLNFVGGRAEVQMLPRGRRTIVVTAQPFGTLSEPMRYEGR